VNSKNGIVFERRLVEAHIDQHHNCPVTGDPLAMEDLISLSAQSVVKPRAPDATSIPSMLSLFQNEWDNLVMDLFTVKKQYNQLRQELSHALYQHDAACRVIARLIRERDQAREYVHHFCTCVCH
jgi:pre-mRNA-processing factor 19